MSDIESSASKMTKRLYANAASASILGHLSSSATSSGMADSSSVNSQSILSSQRSSYSSKNHRFNKIAAACMIGLTLAGGGIGGVAEAANDMSRTPVHADNNNSDAMAEVVSDIAQNKAASDSGTTKQNNNLAENNSSNVSATSEIASVNDKARSASKAGHKGEADSLWKKASEMTDSAAGKDPKDKLAHMSNDQLHRKGYVNGTTYQPNAKYRRYERNLHHREAKVRRARRRLDRK